MVPKELTAEEQVGYLRWIHRALPVCRETKREADRRLEILSTRYKYERAREDVAYTCIQKSL